MKYRFGVGDTYYINCTGTRWIVPGYQIRVIGDNYDKVRKVDYFEQFGNFATATVRVNGKRYTGFSTESDIPGDTLPVLKLDKCRVG
jgi:hypothetical protein